MKYLPFISFLLFLSWNCKPSPEKTLENPLPEDFLVFFDRFHTDSLYQMQHITFPLEGERKASGSQIDIMLPYTWEQEEWVMHKPFQDFGGTFDRSYEALGPVIIEKIQDRNGFFRMERRFARISHEWHLIYYGLKD